MSPPPPDVPARRALLRTLANPTPRRDFVVDLAGHVGGDRPADVSLRYVPDRLVLVPDSFVSYLQALDEVALPSLEHLAAAITDDVANEVVARWTQVIVTTNPGGPGHSVLVEDRQPRWDNKSLLERLRRF